MPRCTRPRPGDPQRCGQGERSTRSDHGRHRPDGRRLRRVSTRCCPRAPPLAFGSGRAAPSTRPTVAMPTAGQHRRVCARSFEHAAAPHPARPPAEVATSPRPWPGLQACPAVSPRDKNSRESFLLFFLSCRASVRGGKGWIWWEREARAQGWGARSMATSSWEARTAAPWAR